MWLFVLVCSMLGGLVTLGGVFSAAGAPQEAAAASIGLALAVIPYCITRAITEMASNPAEESNERLSLILEVLEKTAQRPTGRDV